ncbi:hypothetical protein FRC08_000870 [Ceratobasidium sp. 394]|nr:hypothetical protein FRC08_000870 [Ceratobasidium sp. 394]
MQHGTNDMEPAGNTTPTNVNPRHLAIECHPEYVQTLNRLIERTRMPPLPLQEGSRISVGQELPGALNAAIQELARYYGVSIISCAAWSDGTGTMHTTQASMPVAAPRSISDQEQPLHRDAAFHVPYPDLTMDARPALPIAHRLWKQERETIIVFLIMLWKWQGGPTEPDWDAIAVDINSGSYRMIDRQRLPADDVPFVNPHGWDEEWTWAFLGFIRKSLDSRGRALLSASATCFQYRTIVDEQGNKLHQAIDFQTRMHHLSTIYWNVTPLLCKQRIHRRNHQVMFDTVSHGTGHYASAEVLVLQAKEHVPDILETYFCIAQLEDTEVPEAPAPSPEVAQAWHPALRHAAGRSTLQASATNDWRFPFVWRSPNEMGHADWSTSALKWAICRMTFARSETGVPLTGPFGPGLVFFTVLFYILNVAEHVVLTREERDQMIDQDLAVYGKTDM